MDEQPVQVNEAKIAGLAKHRKGRRLSSERPKTYDHHLLVDPDYYHEL